ncbi:hypothetical protein K504DRAFT_366956 [Pleomassaria siparia CBS 279.74]|uniref:FUN14-domain-containing protein n=1 Tax=Pleomassaria siparia CBS 279.74 TaxID=1314801 RepID=A0A6G1KQA1_9PLEO|nr:hypothetical protein K504DRAFT_366956 [Pleomassaria siparia CBS 279.74]
MAYLLPGLGRGLLISTPLILSAPLLMRNFKRPILCEGPDPYTKIVSDLKNTYAREAKVPVVQQSGALNPKAIRQISLGSILGVIGGLGISVFSKPLALLIGLVIVCVQLADMNKLLESRGIRVIPYSFLQRRVKQANVRSLILDNMAFKLTFGTTFALASFAQL